MKRQYINSFISYLKISPKLFTFQTIIELNKRGIYHNSERFLDRVIEQRNTFVISFLTKKTSEINKTFSTLADSKDKNLKIPKKIWILWWQGEKSAPPLVKICIDSMRNNNPGWDVQVLDQNNFSEFVDIDPQILRLFTTGKIRIQHFSDLIRFELLYRYGGFWVDSTLLSIKPFPDSILDFNFYTAKDTEVSKTSKYWIAINQWVSYFIGSRPGNQSIYWILTNLRDYLRNNRPFPDYLLINYLALIGRNRFPQLMTEYSAIPPNNYFIETGKNYLLSDEFSRVLNSDTTVIKLNHRDGMILDAVVAQKRKMSS